MRLLLRACFGSIDVNGNLAEKEIKDGDTDYLAEAMDGMEIEGVRFSAKFEGDLLIAMEGSDLSPSVTPNYPGKVNAVKQIIHKSPEAKTTSRVLNMFIRKTNRLLSNEPCNREKRHPPNIILIREIEGAG
jgi:2,3-bisphosphoglycerate-independent phosphoglycerate mutase